MAFFSISEFTANGISDIVPVPFGYLLQEHVHVLLDGVEEPQQELTWTSPNTIQLDHVPLAGVLVRVFRSTPLDVASVVFQAGPFSHKDLNIEVLQLLYAAQEVADIAAQIISLNVAGEFDAQGNPIINAGDPVLPADPQDVPTVAYGNANWGGQAALDAQASADAADISEANAATSASNALNSENAADLSEAAAAQSALDAAASAASVELPDPAVADTMLQRNGANTAYVAKSAAAVRTFLGLVIGTDVQAFDADIPTVAATQVEMEAGTEAARRSMSPLGVAQAILAQLPTISQAEAEAGTSTARRAVTAERMAQAIEALAATPDFESAEQTITADSTNSVAHGLGGHPRRWKIILRCKVADIGHAVGDEVPAEYTTTDGVDAGITGAAQSSTILIVQGAFPIRFHDRSVFNTATGTPANWRAVVRAWK